MEEESKSLMAGAGQAMGIALMGLVVLELVRWLGTTTTYAMEYAMDESLVDARFFPEAKADLFNNPLPLVERDWLGEDIAPTSSPSYLRVYVCISIAGVLRVVREVGEEVVVENLNSGVPLTPGAAYMFTIPWRTGDTVNFRYSTSGGYILRLLADEIGAAE